ncbi:hypothetical protein MLD55_12215 [Alcanivorax sp. MM125-6]|nr:hypothetical protein [Alcanivorax sp. MM125-6]
MDAPAPWLLTGRAFVAALSLPADLRHEQGGAAAALGEPARSPALVMLVDYRRSEVGPYQELLFMPGPLRFPDGRRRWSIGRIYVSSQASADNGNRNWGLDKKVAEFDWRRQGRQETVTVHHQGLEIAHLALSRLGPALPFPGAVLPARWRTLGQIRDGHRFLYTPSVSGRLGLARLTEARGDGEHFPALQHGKPLAAASLPRFRMHFPVARIDPLATPTDPAT